MAASTPRSHPLKYQGIQAQQPWILVIPILLLAAGLEFYKLGSESLWIDELYSIHDALLVGLTPLEIIDRLSQIRPIYYVLLRVWTLFGQDEIWLRSLSVGFGVGSVFLTYRLGRQVAGETVGLVASLMLAVSPMFIHFSQMVRMYSVGTFLGILGSFFLALTLEQPKTRYFASWAIARSLVFLTAPLNLALLAADVLLLGITFHQRPKILKSSCQWLLLIGVLCLPSAYSLLDQTLPFLKKALGLTENLAASSKTSSSDLAMELFRKVKKFTIFPFPSTSATVSRVLQTYTLVLVSVAGLAFYKNRHASRVVWVAAWTFVPWFVHAVVSSRMLFDRYIFYTAPFLIILLAAGLVRVWKMHRIVATVIAIAYTVIVFMGLGRYYTVQDRQDWRSLFDFLNQRATASDTLIYSMELVSPDKFSNALKYYNQTEADMVYIGELCENPKITTSEATLRLQQVSAPLNQAWLLCGSGFKQGEFEKILGEYGQVEGHWQFINQAFYREEDYMNLFKVRFTPP